MWLRVRNIHDIIKVQYYLDFKSFRISVYENLGNFLFLSNKFPFQSGLLIVQNSY